MGATIFSRSASLRWTGADGGAVAVAGGESGFWAAAPPPAASTIRIIAVFKRFVTGMAIMRPGLSGSAFLVFERIVLIACLKSASVALSMSPSQECNGPEQNHSD